VVAKAEKKKIVIVEDEEVLALLFRDEIVNAFPDSEVFVFTNSVEAFGFLRANPVHLIITDGKMPQMNGVELARGLNDNGVHTPKFLVTGHIDFIDDIKQEGLFDKVFEKPVEFDDFIKTVTLSLAS
jgi:two-component system response regulator YesN